MKTWVAMSEGIPYARALTTFMSCTFILHLTNKKQKQIRSNIDRCKELNNVGQNKIPGKLKKLFQIRNQLENYYD